MTTTNSIAYELNVTTGEVIERERTPEELATEAADQRKHSLAVAAIEAEATAKAEARAALLDRLGITVDEAAILLS